MDKTSFDFDDIRPYRDDEVSEVVERVLSNRQFDKLISFIYPDTPKEQVYRMMRQCRNIYDFQKNISRTAVKAVLSRSADELTWAGFDYLSRDKGHLFISNHRDIVLDSAILNICLIDEGINTTKTAIGSNLLTTELATDLSKLNRNFIVKRNVPKKELYHNSLNLSRYIHHTIQDEQVSVWLAQREGRSKDGLDLTQPGLLKMLSISCESTYYACFRSLNMLPMAISYEYDPCDFLKVREIKYLRTNTSYQKSKHEDLQSMITGVLNYKGRIHLEIGKVLTDELTVVRNERNKNEKIRLLANIIDQKIHKLYRLWPTNYVAHDMLYSGSRMQAHYNDEDYAKFEAYIQVQLSRIDNADETDKDILLNMYANPVLSFEQYLERRED